MATYTYGATNVSWSSTDDWANEISGLSNISTSGSARSWADDMYDLPGPTNISAGTELKSQTIFYGDVFAGANGQVRVSAPYVTSYAASHKIKNVNLSVHANIILEAAPTYPYIFSHWSPNAANTTIIGTSTSLTITATNLQAPSSYWANFKAGASQTADVFYAPDAQSACISSDRRTVYWPAGDGNSFQLAYALFSDAEFLTPAEDGWYSDRTYTMQQSGGRLVGIAQNCNLLV